MMNTTKNERSSIPAGGMMRRNGASTGSVMSWRIELIDASAEPGRTGNHDSTALAARTTMNTVRTAQRRNTASSGPVEASGLETLLLLFRDLDVARREQEHLVVDALHVAVHRVRQTTREVDEPTLEVAAEPLEVEDHRLVGLEPVAELL